MYSSIVCVCMYAYHTYTYMHIYKMHPHVCCMYVSMYVCTCVHMYTCEFRGWCQVSLLLSTLSIFHFPFYIENFHTIYFGHFFPLPQFLPHFPYLPIHSTLCSLSNKETKPENKKESPQNQKTPKTKQTSEWSIKQKQTNKPQNYQWVHSVLAAIFWAWCLP